MHVDPPARRDWSNWLREVPPGFGHAALRLALCVPAAAYALVVRLRNLAYERGWARVRRVERPVISVGNLTVGGTGKTPLTVWLATWFRDAGVRTAVISRGYRALGADGRNDEALLLEGRLPDVPHLEDPDRIAAAELAIQELDMQLLLLDDGFQHRRLGRDLDLVVIDALDPFGGGNLLPAGLLREPLSGLRRAHAAILTRADLVTPAELASIRDRVSAVRPGLVWAETVHRPSRLKAAGGEELPLERLRTARVAAFCGIGHPRGFRRTLESLGCRPVVLREFPDHHHYTRDELTVDLVAWARAAGAELLVCTEKDRVKIATDALGGIPLAALEIDLEFLAGQAELEALLRPLAERAAGLETEYDEIWPDPPPDVG